jgi:hypothetical protein
MYYYSHSVILMHSKISSPPIEYTGVKQIWQRIPNPRETGAAEQHQTDPQRTDRKRRHEINSHRKEKKTQVATPTRNLFKHRLRRQK